MENFKTSNAERVLNFFGEVLPSGKVLQAVVLGLLGGGIVLGVNTQTSPWLTSVSAGLVTAAGGLLLAALWERRHRDAARKHDELIRDVRRKLKEMEGRLEPINQLADAALQGNVPTPAQLATFGSQARGVHRDLVALTGRIDGIVYSAKDIKNWVAADMDDDTSTS